MTKSTPKIDTNFDKQDSEQSWNSLYPVLFPLAKSWVYAAHLYSWSGQEIDIAWDIVLVTIQRTYEYHLKTESGIARIESFQRFSITTARHYFHDLRRKDSKLLPLNREGCTQIEYTIHDEIDFSEVIQDKDYHEWLLKEIATIVANFSPKLRRAMLIHIARNLDFDTQPTTIQTAFLKEGIRLEEYAGLFPQEPILRSRHSSLVSLGRKHLKMLLRNCEFCDCVTAAIGA
jgi:hypothetical protein